MAKPTDTIAAIATPVGRGGIGVIRISGPDALNIAEQITQANLQKRHAHYLPFFDSKNEVVDQGIALYFKAPNSFTGEDVVELQGHGGPVVLDIILQQIVAYGARLAAPGEFSERAFLNDKLDLAQAEAIADLIDASSQQAARSAIKSVKGDFSNRIHQLVESLIALRLYVEAAIDFPEEEIDFLSDGKVLGQLEGILAEIVAILASAQQGSILRDGMTIVIAGRPNAGKSSLLNALIGTSSAIVTDIPGTTRDLLKEYIQIEGVPLHIIDTAGLRPATDKVEQLGIERARREIAEADRLLLVLDSNVDNIQLIYEELIEELRDNIPNLPDTTVLLNKQDLLQKPIKLSSPFSCLSISAKKSEGIEQLKQHLLDNIGFHNQSEGVIIARRRHIDAIEKANLHCNRGKDKLVNYNAGELLAEELRQAQNCLSSITGEFTADDLLGRIFSSFCIGK